MTLVGWLSFLTLSFLLQSCGSETVKVMSSDTPLLIDTKAQIKSNNETHNVKLEIALLPNRAMRIEISALLGYRVATVLMTPQKIQYALHTNETYFSGPFEAKSLYPIFRQAIDPRILWRVIHNQSPQSSYLICKNDNGGRPVSCEGPRDLLVTWTYEEPPRKRIEIKNNQFEMNWIFKDQMVLKQAQNETFVLKKPEGYKEIVLK